MRLTSSYSRIAVDIDRAAWWVSPEGDVQDSGEFHTNLFKDTSAAVLRGWVRLGYTWGNPYIECSTMTQKQLETIQETLTKFGLHSNQYVNVTYGGGKGAEIPFRDFRVINKASEFRDWPDYYR
jgi:hypothetical protein